MIQKQLSLKPQDVIILAKIITLENKHEKWRICDIAYLLDISAAEVCRSLNRLEICHLFSKSDRKPQREAFMKFIQNGLMYVFPALVGKIEDGLQTMFDTETDETVKENKNEKIVWSRSQYNSSNCRGESVVPLFKSLKTMEFHDPDFKEIMVLIDNIRLIGELSDSQFQRMRELILTPKIKLAS